MFVVIACHALRVTNTRSEAGCIGNNFRFAGSSTIKQYRPGRHGLGEFYKSSHALLALVQIAKREPKSQKFFLDFNEAGRAEVLHAHEFRLGARCEVTKRLNVQQLQSLSSSN